MKPSPKIEDSLRLSGHVVDLRPIREVDAEYVHSLRTDPTLARHLSPINGTVEDQQRWILRYKTREAAGKELYFVILSKSGTACGLVRLYEIAPPKFTWGSIILGRNSPAKAALEATLLSMAFGFEHFNCLTVQLDVRRQNAHAIDFYRRFGLQQVGEDEIDLFFELDKATFETLVPNYEAAVRS